MPGNLIDLRAFLAELSSLFPDTSVDEDLMALIDSSVISVSGSADQRGCTREVTEHIRLCTVP